MERGSDKHSSRIDEELEREVQAIVKGEPTESRAQEFRQMEGPVEPDGEDLEGLPLPETGEGSPDQSGPTESENGEERVEPGDPEAGPESGGPPA